MVAACAGEDFQPCIHTSRRYDSIQTTAWTLKIGDTPIVRQLSALRADNIAQWLASIRRQSKRVKGTEIPCSGARSNTLRN